MRKPGDMYLERLLQNWAAMQQPPTATRARLLQRAAGLPAKQDIEWLSLYQPDILLKWVSPFALWSLAQPFDNTGIAGSRMLA